MRKIAILVFLATVLISMNAFASEKLRFAAVENVPPFTFEENGEIKGISIEIFKEIRKRMGFRSSIRALPFKRLLFYLKSGRLDGAIQIYYKKSREEFLIYSEVPGYWSAHHVFIRRGDDGRFPTQTLQDLFGKRVAKEKGFFVTEEFQKAVDQGKITLDEAQNTKLNLTKLVNGRMDCYVSNYHIALYNIGKFGFQNKIVPLTKPLAPKKGTFMAISKKAERIPNKAEFMAEFSRVLKEIHSDGTLESIQNKYR
ncbi:substrate-binding periplasmic protein [Thermodesulfobacteriota bacterium]